MYCINQNCWKRNGIFYATPSIAILHDEICGFSLEAAWLCWSVEIGKVKKWER